MKKIVTSVGLLSSLVLLAACGGGKAESKEDGRNSASTRDVKFEVLDGEYVMPQDGSSDENYLALKVKVSNNSSEKIYLSSSDIQLYDEDGDKISSESVYDSTGDFETLSGENVSKGKSVTGYVVYEVDEDTEYELQYTPMLASYEESDEVALAINTGDYENHMEDATELAESYVNTVFLNGEVSAGTSNVSFSNTDTVVSNLKTDNKKKDSDDKDDEKGKDKDEKDSDKKKDGFTLGGDLEKERTDFYSTFIEALESDYYYYEPSEAELRTVAEAYTAANAKRAKVTYSVKSYLPGSVTLYVRPEVIDWETLDTDEIISKFVEENAEQYANSDYEDIYKAAEKYVMENIPSYLDTAAISTSDYMYDKEGFQLTFHLKDDEWVVDTNDYQYDNLVKAFIGS